MDENQAALKARFLKNKEDRRRPNTPLNSAALVNACTKAWPDNHDDREDADIRFAPLDHVCSWLTECTTLEEFERLLIGSKVRMGGLSYAFSMRSQPINNILTAIIDAANAQLSPEYQFDNKTGRRVDGSTPGFPPRPDEQYRRADQQAR